MKNDHQGGAPLETDGQDACAHVRANVTFGGDSLLISYEVTAITETGMVFFDALQRLGTDGNLKYDRLTAYVSFEGPDALVIKRVVPNLPKHKNVEMAYVPWVHQVTRLSPCRGEIRIPLPAEECNPYYPPGKSAVYRKAWARKLSLVLEYAPLEDSLTLVPIEGLDNVFRVEGVGVKLQQIHVTLGLRNSVPVKRRSDRFEPV